MRINRDQLMMDIAGLISSRSTCARAHVGCVITRQGRILSTGYAGSPSGLPHCEDVGCDIVDDHCIRTAHAEAGAIAWAAREGIALKDSVLYTTHAPCHSCAKLIINSGIVEVHYLNPYHDEGLGIRMLEESGVKVCLP